MGLVLFCVFSAFWFEGDSDRDFSVFRASRVQLQIPRYGYPLQKKASFNGNLHTLNPNTLNPKPLQISNPQLELENGAFSWGLFAGNEPMEKNLETTLGLRFGE